MKKNILSLLLCLSVSFTLYAQSKSEIYGINLTAEGLYLGKIDLNTGTISNCPNELPPALGQFSTAHFPAIDPLGNRYFALASNKLWSVDLNTGEVLGSYDVNYSQLSHMQYNYLDNSIYGIAISSDQPGLCLGKIDLTTGIISNCPIMLPAEFNEFGSQYSPAIDAPGKRYFLIASRKLWSIDLNTGEVLNSYAVSQDDLWLMQYNLFDSTLYGLNKTFDPYELHLGKMDLSNGLISNCPAILPSDFNGISSQYTPAIDPLGNRYFIITPNDPKLWSLDLSTGEVLNSYEVGYGNLWQMQFNYKESILGIEQPALTKSIKIYPNPTHQYINIDFRGTNAKIIKITISDTRGQVLLDKSISNNHEIIDISELSNGMYIMEIIEKQGRTIEKVIKY